MTGDRDESAQPSMSSTAGRSLKRIFRQDDSLARIEEQPATRSLLMNPVRLGLFMHLCRNPGEHVRGASRAAGLSLNNTSWHLKSLAVAGYIIQVQVSGRSTQWPRGMVDADDTRLVAELRNPESMAILRAFPNRVAQLAESEIVSAVNTSQQTASARLSRMVSAGLLERHGIARSTRYSYSAVMLDVEARYREGAAGYSRQLLELLRQDGLMPKRPIFKGTRLAVSVSLPAGTQRIKLECNPVSSLTRLLSRNR